MKAALNILAVHVQATKLQTDATMASLVDAYAPTAPP